MKNKCKYIVGLVLLFLLAGCGGTQTTDSYDKGFYDSMSESATVNGSFKGDYVTNDSAGYNPGIQAEDGMESKIIVNGDLTMETKNFDETIKSLETLIKDCGGYIQSSHVHKAPDGVEYVGSKSAYYTVRIPATKYNEFIKGNEGIGNVTDLRTSTEDITSSYYDTATRISNLKAQEARVADMYKQAKTINELIQIENRLSDLRSEIEVLELRVKNWDVLTRYSTVDIEINEVKELTVRTTGFFDKLKESFVYSWKETFVGGLQAFILALALNSSSIVVWLVIALVAIRIYKRYQKKNKEKMEAIFNLKKESKKEIKNTVDVNKNLENKPNEKDTK